MYLSRPCHNPGDPGVASHRFASQHSPCEKILTRGRAARLGSLAGFEAHQPSICCGRIYTGMRTGVADAREKFWARVRVMYPAAPRRKGDRGLLVLLKPANLDSPVFSSVIM
jgi:hypothetical protein